jgi:anaerobic ribonucleoside-triphosphate reductase
MEEMRMTKCDERVEVFSRVVGYFRPVARWNDGKKEEFSERKTFEERKALESDFERVSDKTS